MAPEPIAIIGTGCRFPSSSTSPSRLWDLISKPKDVATKPPAERFNMHGFYDPNPSNLLTTNAKESYFLSESVRQFDAPFFNIAANEAGSLDPQQRLLLETVYESLEAAGLRMEALRGSSTGVFCGVMVADWEAIMGLDKVVPEYAISGLARNNLANRISYFFDWNGPSMAIDTACSSSMVALHQGVSALQNGECSVVAAVGTNLILSPNLYFAASNVHMLSPDSRCRMWDDRANGYARGEGVASVIMKRLSDAIADGDSIECVIRASGVNQDGRTLGLTMPSGAAQEKLIRSTYALAGLDPSRPEDRPQYFEAHGTGTQAGDFQESSGIFNAFFASTADAPSDEILHVGSIKTVLGHAEGCAGLAGIIKASLCLQHGIIPPNLHFENLNPKLEPYASRLVVPTKQVEWPQLKPGAPRRVSVNSFGFGGTNSHAILESYEPNLHKTPKPHLNGTSKILAALLPFAFSAASEKSLGALLEKYTKYLAENPHVDLLDFASTLIQNRSALMYRVTLHASTVDELQSAIQKELALRKAKEASTIISRPEAEKKKILGIFTGQGAQWPQMGFDLLSTFPAAQGWFQELQKSLDELPSKYRPDFTLLGELSTPKSSSRVQIAAISQPLCTAVQIVLVNVLSALGITFDTVVGHSSGEIGAAYAAGILNARDAIRIAYLRGKLANLAGSCGQQGGMLAAGLSMEEATAFCAEPEFAGRICIAACNSGSSVTLSGDAEAIKEAEFQLKSNNKFARALLVDTAYHSHHMQPCADPYLQALIDCKIQLKEPNTTAWYSTVYEGMQLGSTKDSTALAGKYWVDNMCNPVLFYPGLKAAIAASSPGLIIEVGPHPALKGPVLQAVSETIQGVPYVATLTRGTTGVEALAGTIGSLWTYLGAEGVNIAQYIALREPSRKLEFVQNLPSYPFDHTQSYWTETRRSKAYLYRDRRHELLGDISEEIAEGEWRWRNFLFPTNLEYLNGHQIQSQTVFPATGYVALALEASKIMGEGKSMSLFQINDLVIDQAIAFPEDSDAGIETLFRMYQIKTEGNVTYATFNCHAGLGGTLKSCASGQLVVTWGETEVDALPSKSPSPSGFLEVNTDEFYSTLSKLGYGYSGLFRGVTKLERKLNASSGLLNNVPTDSLLLHPSTMDCGLQTLLAAMGALGDGELSCLQIPTRIQTTTINPKFCGSSSISENPSLKFEANVIGSGAEGGVAGDVNLFTADGHGLVQFEGIHVTPLMQRTAKDDRPLFSEIAWSYLEPNAEPSHIPTAPAQFWLGKIDDPQHICFAVIQELLAKLTNEDRENLKGHRSDMVAWCDRVVELTREGRHPLCRTEWIGENPTEVLVELYKTAQPIIVEITEAIRHNFLAFLRNEVAMIEVYRKDNLLTRFYAQEQEMKYMSMRVGDLAGQLAFRYPRMKILEIGGGTGSATRSVLGRIGQDFHSYTFTDISAGFFEDAEATFNEYPDRMTYRVLDIEQDPIEQGFEANSYDLVIASNVLHATKYLQPTMTNARRLLKPGGHLIALEITSEFNLQDALLFGVFEGWWLGKIDQRLWGPKISVPKWDELLRNTGFGGVDTIVPAPGNPEYAYWCYSAFVTQAVDDHVLQIREPLPSPTSPIPSDSLPKHENLLIVGGATSKSKPLLPALQKLLTSSFRTITHAPTIASVDDQDSSLTAILCLEDIDQPFFQDLTEKKFSSLKRLLDVGKRWLWVTVGSEAENPYLSMAKGFLSCIGYEYRGSLHQYLNIIDPTAVGAELLATTLMRNVNFEYNNDYSLSNCVGSVELALRLEDNIMKIPRIVEATPLNLRYAATRRAVTQQVDLETSAVRLGFIEDKSAFIDANDDVQEDSVSNLPSVQIRVHHSTALAFKVEGAGFLSLVLGTQEDSTVRLVALSAQNASCVSVPQSWTYEVPASVGANQEAQYLKTVASAVLAQRLVQQTKTNTGLLVHGADDILRQAISAQAAAKGIQSHFSSSDPAVKESTSNTLFFHQTSSSRALRRVLPGNLSVIANFDKVNSRVFSTIERLLSQGITSENTSSLCRQTPSLPKGFNIEAVNQTIKVAGSVAVDVLLAKTGAKTSVLAVGELAKRDQEPNALDILDWTNAHELPVQVSPASSKVKLSANKTYLLVGMAGDLGRSVAQWMITRGARNVVLTSRTPKAEPLWIDEMSKLGARVRIESMDVTDPESILKVDSIIRQTLPPVGGVVNGAMVLQDQLFADSSLQTILATYKPKVNGSRLLEEIYGGEKLDFFILFGSATAVLGNMGQSSYGAATNYMRSMIRRRQELKLVGSIIHPAEVRGVGYISRMGTDLLKLMTRLLGGHVVSEKDLHELFAEAILAGDPNSGRNPEIIAGFTQHDPEAAPDIIWYTNPEAWPLANYHLHATSSKSTGTVIPVKEQLESATTIDEAAELVLGALTAKITQKLHLSEDTSVTPDTKLAELGADSLVAVDLRTWFLVQLEVEMPILQILGGASLRDLADTAAAGLADHLIPNVAKE